MATKVKWTEEEDRVLIDLYKSGWAAAEVAHRLKRNIPGVTQRNCYLKQKGKLKGIPRSAKMISSKALKAFGLKPCSLYKIVSSEPKESRAEQQRTRREVVGARKPSYPAQLAKLAKDAEELFNVSEFVKSAAADNRTIHDLIEDMNFVAKGA